MFATTYLEDFNWPKSTSCGIKNWQTDRIIQPSNKICKNMEEKITLYRNNETLTKITKECLVPFDYLLSPKPIIQTTQPQHIPLLELPKDDSRARFTRPRVYKAPEISMDDIEDPEIREKIIEHAYSTTWGLASKEAAITTKKTQIPISSWEPLYHVSFNKQEAFINKVKCDRISQSELNNWDKSQRRFLVDPTLTFWKQFRNQKKAKLIDQSVIDVTCPEYIKNILCLERHGKLRFAYKLKPPNYAGFMPDIPVEIEPEKQELQFSDPMITVYQLSNRWVEKDN